jgi:2-iminobutanoate/2-iminopropanoate deaminase
MIRQAVSTDDAPHAIGPYSQAIVANGFVFCSGTAGIDPATDVAPDGIEEQTELALRNLDAILTAAGASLATLVKTTIFYANVNEGVRDARYALTLTGPDHRQGAHACQEVWSRWHTARAHRCPPRCWLGWPAASPI